jgi:hypothetical protein
VDSEVPIPKSTNGSTWSRTANRFDLLVLVGTVACALVTLWFSTAPMVSTSRLLLLGMVWPIAGAASALSVAVVVQRPASLLAALVMLVAPAPRSWESCR